MVDLERYLQISILKDLEEEITPYRHTSGWKATFSQNAA